MKAAAAATTMHTTPIHMGAEAAATRSAPSTSALPAGHAHDLHQQASNTKDQANDQHHRRSHLEAALRSVLKRVRQRRTSTPRPAPSRLKPSTATGTIGVFQEAMVSHHGGQRP